MTKDSMWLVCLLRYCAEGQSVSNNAWTSVI